MILAMLFEKYNHLLMGKNMIRNLFLVIVCVTFISAENNFYRLWINNYDKILKKHVKENRKGKTTVHYKNIRNDSEFKKMMDVMGGTKGKHTRKHWAVLSKDEKVAFRINFHNALAIKLIVNHPGLRSVNDINPSRDYQDVFCSNMHRKAFTLNSAKKQALVDSGNNPMILFAFNRCNIGDAPLRPEAYVGWRLKDQLEDQLKKYMSLDNGMKIDRRKKKLVLSKVFEENASLFNGNPAQFLQSKGIINRRVASFRVSFINGKWIRNINCSTGQN